MQYLKLKEQVYEANLELERRDLVIYTFGNVSQIDRDSGVIAIKPSGVSYSRMTVDDIVVIDLDGNHIEGELRPSSDTPTHLHLYRKFSEIGGVTHTHSTYATAWAQAQCSIPCLGTTHADYVYGDIPCSDVITDEQIEHDYELETGVQITESLAGRSPSETPMALVAGHAPFTWGKDADESVYHAVILEQLAKMAWITLDIAPDTQPLKKKILEKHYLRKHGKNAYYGQE